MKTSFYPGRMPARQTLSAGCKTKTQTVRELESLNASTFPEGRVTQALEAHARLPEAPLLGLPRTRLSASFKPKGCGGTITIRNETNIPAFNVIIQHFPYQYGAYLENNSFCLYPHEVRAIAFEVPDHVLSFERLTLRAWNAPQVPPAGIATSK